MKKILVILIFLNSITSHACSCVFKTFDKSDYDNAEYVVKGKVLKVEVDKENYQKTITFKVTRNYKGKEEILKITTGIDSASCGINVQKDDKWLLFVSSYKGVLSVGSCGKNVRINKRPNQSRVSYKKNCKTFREYRKKIKKFKK